DRRRVHGRPARPLRHPDPGHPAAHGGLGGARRAGLPGRSGPAAGLSAARKIRPRAGMADGRPFVSLDVTPARSKPPGPTFVASSDHLPRGEHGGSVSPTASERPMSPVTWASFGDPGR